MTFDEMPTAVRLPFAFDFLFTAFMVDSYIFLHSLNALNEKHSDRKKSHIRNLIAIKNGLSVVKFIAKHLPT